MILKKSEQTQVLALDMNAGSKVSFKKKTAGNSGLFCVTATE
jgi:hypothetical protein